MRPAPLVDVRPQERVGQHSGIGFELVQALDVPVLQMVEQPVEVDSFFRNFVPAVAEQVIEVPKLALLVRAVQRAALPEPQLVEQLVEVPTVLSYSLLQQRTAEQTIGFPVPGRGGGARGGLQGLSQGQGSTTFPPPERISERIMEQNVDFPGGGLDGVQGFLTRQSSAALSEQVPVSAFHAATARVVEFMASAPSVHAAPGSSGDDASRVEQDMLWRGGIIWAEWFITRGPASFTTWRNTYGDPKEWAPSGCCVTPWASSSSSSGGSVSCSWKT